MDIKITGIEVNDTQVVNSNNKIVDVKRVTYGINGEGSYTKDFPKATFNVEDAKAAIKADALEVMKLKTELEDFTIEG